MTSFVVETSTPAATALVTIKAEARLAAAELSEAGTPARYLRSIFVPADELCLLGLNGCAFGGFANAVAGVHRPLLVPRLRSSGTKEPGDRPGRGSRVAAPRCARHART